MPRLRATSLAKEDGMRQSRDPILRAGPPFDSPGEYWAGLRGQLAS